MNKDHLEKVSEEAFWDWLKSRVTPRQLSEMYRYAYDLNSYYVPQYRFDTSILNEMARSSVKRVRDAIRLDKSFRNKYSQYDRQFISNLLDYMELFLKDNKPVLSDVKNFGLSMETHTEPGIALRPEDIRESFIFFIEQNISWQKDDLVSALEKLEKNIGWERLFNPNMEEALTSLKLLRYQQKYKISGRLDKKVMDLLEKFFIQQKENPDYFKNYSSIYRRSDSENKENTDQNEDIRLALKKLSNETSDKISSAMVAKGINNRLTPYQVKLILDKAAWADKYEDNSYRYLPQESDDSNEMGKKDITNTVFTIEDSNIDTLKPDLKESVRATLEDISKKKPYGVSVVYIASRINQHKSLVMKILEEADWAKKTNEGFVYVTEPTATIPTGSEEQKITSVRQETVIEEPGPQQWEDYECAILLEACLEMKRKHKNRGTVISQVSAKLRSIAKNKGLSIDKSFRNETSIRNQMLRMESAINGKTLMQASTRQFRRIVEIYKTDRDGFNSLLLEAEKPGGIETHKVDDTSAVKSNAPERYAEPADIKKTEEKQEPSSPYPDPDSPAAQPRWTEQEAAVLLDAYLKVQENPEQKKEIVLQVSDQLRQMAINQGIEISDTYRNIDGVTLQMNKMESAFRENTDNHFASSKVFREIVRLYREERGTFNHLFQEAKKLCNVPEQDHALVLITKNDFRGFLTKKGFTNYQQTSIWASIFSMQQKCNVTLFDSPLEKFVETTNQLEQKLSDPVFLTSGRKEAVSLLMEFLSGKTSEKNSGEYVSKTESSSIDEPRGNSSDYIITEKRQGKEDIAEDDGKTGAIVVKDEEWIIAQLQDRKLQYRDNRWKNGSLWILGGHELDDFIEECRQHGYTMWFKTDGGRNYPWQERWFTNDIVNDRFGFGETEPVDVNPTKNDRWLSILRKSFPDGYILDDFVCQLQAGTFWEEQYGEPCPIAGDLIDEAMKAIGTVLDGRVYAKNDKDNILIAEICDDINRVLAQYTCVYRICVYERYREKLAAQSIYTEPVMTQQLLNNAKGSFYSINKIFAKPGREASSLQDGRKVLRDHGGAMNVNDIAKELWFIPYDHVYHNLSIDSETINIGIGKWMLAEHFPLSHEDALRVGDMLDDYFVTQDNVKQSEIMPLLRDRLPSIANDLSGLQSNAIFNILNYHLKDRFSFTKAIIAPRGVKTDYMDIFREFARDHDQFSLDELSAFAKAQKTGIYWSDTFIGGAVRINRTEFINRRMITFDVTAIDNVLERLCVGDYLAIHEVTDAMMLHLTPCGYQWNGYLLQSYLFSFSSVFKLINNSFSKTGFFGAIVRRSCTKIGRYDQLVEQVLIDDRTWKNSDDAITLLVRKGFQERHRLDGIDKIIARIP